MSYNECRELFRVGIIDALESCRPLLKTIVSDEDGIFPVDGLGVYVAPWHNDASIAVRKRKDPAGFHVPAWEHFDDFFNECVCNVKSICRAGAHAQQVYDNPPKGVEHEQVAHLIYLAAADALLDISVREKFFDLLNSLQSGSEFYCDDYEFKGSSAWDGWFDYVIHDPDQSGRPNYCDVIVANRVTEFALPRWQ